MLCLDDSYCKECEATVTGVKDGKFIALDKNLFYPRGGGQPTDTGKIIRGNDDLNQNDSNMCKFGDDRISHEFKVVFVGKFDGKVSHEVDKEGLKEGDKVKCIIDWERRYKLMRTHTAAHVLASTMHKELGALITGN